MPPRTWPTPRVALRQAAADPVRHRPSWLASPSPSSVLPCSRSGVTASDTRAGPITACTPGSLEILRCQRLSALSSFGLGDRPVFGGGDDDEGRFETGSDGAGDQFAVGAGGVVLVELFGDWAGPELQRQRGAGEEQHYRADRDRDRQPGRRRAAATPTAIRPGALGGRSAAEPPAVQVLV